MIPSEIDLDLSHSPKMAVGTGFKTCPYLGSQWQSIDCLRESITWVNHGSIMGQANADQFKTNQDKINQNKINRKSDEASVLTG
ncbi:MAG: hypothetical protein EA001_05385 [Oscillatoriales cyanobacterium]|nr:MAG: hypothetical protein EA001_05385 [Oscillatoriales cyanobacterium]